MNLLLTPALVLEKLKEVIDPEVGLNVVDMGLVYDVRVAPEGITVEMTLTTPGCPMSSYLTQQVRAALDDLHGAGEPTVQLVWSPPWSPAKIRPEAMAELRRRNER
jgi:metal-sulfur cluster biosynthetic enzyme